MLRHAHETLGLRRIVAITSIDNEASIGLLEKIGLRFERLIVLGDAQEEIRLYATP